jgi:hypothetical protein
MIATTIISSISVNPAFWRGNGSRLFIDGISGKCALNQLHGACQGLLPLATEKHPFVAAQPDVDAPR